jgi:hypothetical protein
MKGSNRKPAMVLIVIFFIIASYFIFNLESRDLLSRNNVKTNLSDSHEEELEHDLLGEDFPIEEVAANQKPNYLELLFNTEHEAIEIQAFDVHKNKVYILDSNNSYIYIYAINGDLLHTIELAEDDARSIKVEENEDILILYYGEITTLNLNGEVKRKEETDLLTFSYEVKPKEHYRRDNRYYIQFSEDEKVYVDFKKQTRNTSLSADLIYITETQEIMIQTSENYKNKVFERVLHLYDKTGQFKGVALVNTRILKKDEKWGHVLNPVTCSGEQCFFMKKYNDEIQLYKIYFHFQDTLVSNIEETIEKYRRKISKNQAIQDVERFMSYLRSQNVVALQETTDHMTFYGWYGPSITGEGIIEAYELSIDIDTMEIRFKEENTEVEDMQQFIFTISGEKDDEDVELKFFMSYDEFGIPFYTSMEINSLPRDIFKEILSSG